MDKVMKTLGYSEKLAINARGKAGGLCMMWINSIDVKVLEFDSNIIAIEIKEGNCVWVLVGFYGPAYTIKRRGAWEHLNALLESIQEPWACFGDFNLTISDEEKLGGRRGNSSRQNFLQDMMFELGAIVLGYSGNQFTWSNNRWGTNAIKERLDRGIASISWRLKFPKATIYYLGAIKSDHCPIVLDTNPVDTFYPRPFRFEAAWTRDPRSLDIVKEAWVTEAKGSECFKLYRKQYNTQMALKKWNREVFGHYQHRIDSLMLQI